MKRVLCISDSLGLPRSGVDYARTWFSILQKKIPVADFISVFRRNGTTEMLASSGDYGDSLWFFAPQIIILQLGICDCAPRYIRTTSLLYRLLYRFPSGLSGIIWKWIKLVRKRSLNCTDVPLGRFRQNLVNYIEQCVKADICRIIIIKIAVPGKAMIKENPEILQAIKLYNDVYDQLAKEYPSLITVVDPLSEGNDLQYVEDGYHPNGCGNAIVAETLEQELMRYV